MKKGMLLTVTLLALTGCGTVTHVGAKPDFSTISTGMSQQEVIAELGKPEEIAATDGTTYLRYSWSPWYDHDGADGNKQDYFVRLVDGKVDSFGRVGDFDSTRYPEQTINVNVDQK